MFAPTPPPPSAKWVHLGDEWLVAMVSHRGRVVDTLAAYSEKEYFKLKLAGSLEAVLLEHYYESL